jgi:N-methylhydantoinase B
MRDPILLELLQTRLTSVVREMRSIMIRTAYSPMIHEGHDFSCAVLSKTGDLVAASEVEQPTHISALPWAARSVIARYGADIGPGDQFLHNDPYTGGAHLNDVALYFPVFHNNIQIALLGIMAHWQDIGGMVPGSLSGTATEIYQEGVRIPGIRITRRGKPILEATDLLFANVRQPDERRGDLQAMIGACRIAEKRLIALVERWGIEATQSGMTALLDRAEARMRDSIRNVPNGIYEYETHLDNTGDSPEPLLLKLRLTIKEDILDADFSGSALQVSGPTNLGPATSTTAVFTMSKALLDPNGPINAGAMRPLSVTAPLGTVVNARPPAACGAIGEVRRALESLVIGTLGQAMPDCLVGDLKGASNITAIGGPHLDRGDDFLFVEFPAGGTGAFAGGDGNNTMRNFAEGDISSIQPVESIELTCPLRVESTSLRTNSGGAGKWRGGLGLTRKLRLLAPHGRLSVLSDRNIIPPYGVRGGKNSAPNRFTVQRNNKVIQPSELPGKVSAFPLREGDIVIEETAGGGGYGDPLERDPLLAARDAAFDYVSESTVLATYGVVMQNGKVDEQATATARSQIANDRVHLTLQGLQGIVDSEFDGSRRIAIVSSSTAKHLHATQGTLIELPNPDGPSLRAWLRIDDAVRAGHCAIGSSALAILSLTIGASVEVRLLDIAAH